MNDRVCAGMIDATGFTPTAHCATAGGDGVYFDRMPIAAVTEPGAYETLLAGLGVLAHSTCRKKTMTA